jgi:hypothetical protein
MFMDNPGRGKPPSGRTICNEKGRKVNLGKEMVTRNTAIQKEAERKFALCAKAVFLGESTAVRMEEKGAGGEILLRG